MPVTAQLSQLSRQYLGSKVNIGYQALSCLLVVSTLIYVCIRFSNPNAIMWGLELTISTMLILDLGIRILAETNTVQFILKFANALDTVLLCLLVLVLAIRLIDNDVGQYDWFINACNVLLLGAALAKRMMRVAESVCRMLDAKYVLLEGIDYKTYATTPSTQMPVELGNGIKKEHERQIIQASLQQYNKYEQFVEEDIGEGVRNSVDMASGINDQNEEKAEERTNSMGPNWERNDGL